MSESFEGTNISKKKAIVKIETVRFSNFQNVRTYNNFLKSKTI
ncbi:hypothetical protein LEP1GSC132_3333 [Leptospira kirschneri str. 200803703]|nr:hypothetical protein LEP1GSC064_2015 [Leptospira kirschneri serovar Grippotyphosa str. Moskva]EKR07743.1 hypothetical protein LEP1GSC122_2646 [Leptospira kirschneri serovar Valbuzzi str. 200702274]EMK03524.1 hypothetical protein LEP1GSC176_3234 [Leptospira kirschneri str. MMD1493]EMK13383.1 hypothetical protein LEP1GSC042_3669 [Leptospira kirschneri serovar Bim str. PUO 1247]EMN03303.1 hypothetical protein LEP1GSC046_3284 [Leptospira kirschneri serovar Bim str. 1051]EMN25883.1 hypothetical 